MSESMIFIDKCLDDDIINLIEVMVNHHISGNYQEIRNIILGKYGEQIIKAVIEKDEPKSPYINRQIFHKKGMTFYDGEVYENVRILMDERTRGILEVLFTISKNTIEYRQIIDIIVSEWNKNSVKMSDITNIDPDVCGSLSLHGIEIKEDLWKDLKRISKNKRISVANTFKCALMQFLKDRSEILRD